MTDSAPNLEEELAACDWFIAKVRASEIYAQNVYAALCNMRWQPQEVWPVLQDDYWTCTWRYAGEVVANLRVDFNEDYMDWYCSGMSGRAAVEDDVEEEIRDKFNARGYVGEGEVTDEIREDFARLGWHPSPWPKDKEV